MSKSREARDGTEEPRVLGAALALAASEQRFALFSRACGSYLEILEPAFVGTLRARGTIGQILPRDFPEEWPECLRPLAEGEFVEPSIIVLASIRDPEERARALLSSSLTDDCDRAHELILSVADAGWPGAIAQGMLRLTDEQQAAHDRLQESRDAFARDARRVRRSLERHSPWFVRELRDRRAPWLVRNEPSGPSLLDILAELDGPREHAERGAR